MNEEHSTEPWECGACHGMTTESHFYSDAMGVMQHEAVKGMRHVLASNARHTRERLIAEGHEFPPTDFVG